MRSVEELMKFASAELAFYAPMRAVSVVRLRHPSDLQLSRSYTCPELRTSARQCWPSHSTARKLGDQMINGPVRGKLGGCPMNSKLVRPRSLGRPTSIIAIESLQ